MNDFASSARRVDLAATSETTVRSAAIAGQRCPSGRRIGVRGKRILCVVAILIASLVAAGWLKRDWLTAQYYVYRLTHVEDAALQEWVSRVSEWGESVEPALLAELAIDDGPRCERAGQALAQLHRESTPALASILAARYESFSPAAQDWAIQQAAGWKAAPADEEKCRQLIDRALHSSSTAIRLRAIGLAQQLEESSLEFLAPLIDDPDAEVRRAIVLTLGAHRDWLSDDELLPRLHDPVREVQRLARIALLSRGLTEEQVQMGCLLTDSLPTARLELITLLRNDSELDLNAWLSRLSHDSSPAVRVAAVRSAAELRIFQLSNRLAEIVASDPDATVRSIAKFHWKQIQAAPAVESELPAQP
jgi:hypothetical protein